MARHPASGAGELERGCDLYADLFICDFVGGFLRRLVGFWIESRFVEIPVLR